MEGLPVPSCYHEAAAGIISASIFQVPGCCEVHPSTVGCANIKSRTADASTETHVSQRLCAYFVRTGQVRGQGELRHRLSQLGNATVKHLSHTVTAVIVRL